MPLADSCHYTTPTYFVYLGSEKYFVFTKNVIIFPNYN